jgi:hypothetical protein
MRIWGLTASTMNQLSRIGVKPTAVRNNVVTVTAGDSGGNMSLAFAGVIMDAWPNFSQAPEVSLDVIAFTGILAAMKPIAPSSYPGATDVAVIMKDLAGKMGYTLENNGVSVILSSPYLPGTARMQALAAAEAADIFVVFDDDNGVMAILPKTGARNGTASTLDPTNGTLIGYPSYIGPGQIRLRCLYNPAVRFMGNVNVQNSLVDGANGTWRVTNLVHVLESQIPDGAWFSDIVGNNLLTSSS